ncbi:hypothetical protein K438DRAFT_402629 [Mycena galopus ATCC 62051]|nr:hypothetical protein K438DRAFT_402629 [Mycena galopus ATCC 62051]
MDLIVEQEELFDGIPRINGNVARIPSLDLRRCVVGRERLSTKQFHPGYTLGWVRKWDFDGCTSLTLCRAAQEDVLSWYLDNADIWALSLPDHLGGFKFCAACTRHMHDCMTAGRQRVWEELPAIFYLPPWSELKNLLAFRPCPECLHLFRNNLHCPWSRLTERTPRATLVWRNLGRQLRTSISILGVLASAFLCRHDSPFLRFPVRFRGHRTFYRWHNQAMSSSITT